MHSAPCQPKCVLGSLELAHFGQEYLCRRPSDDGPYVFVRLKDEPSALEHFVIEINHANRKGNARHGRVLWSTTQVLEELATVVKGGTWLRDRHGDVWMRGLKVSVGEFDAHLLPGSYSATLGDLPARIVFVPVEGSRYRELKNHLANWLELEDISEVARAEVASFAPGVTPAPGKGEAVAEALKPMSTTDALSEQIAQASHGIYLVQHGLVEARMELGDVVVQEFLNKIPERGEALWVRFRLFQEHESARGGTQHFLDFVAVTNARSGK